MRSKKALLNIISSILMQVIAVIYGFVVPKIILSKFGSNVNGLVTSITQFLGYIVLLESGFGPVVKSILYKPLAEKDNKKIATILYKSERFFRTIALVFIIYIIALCFIYPAIINSDFEFLFTVSLIIIISISTFAEYFFGMTYKLFLQSDQKTYIISIIQIFTYCINILIVIILANLNCSIHVIKLVSGLIFVLRPVLQNLYVRKKYNIDYSDVDKNYVIKQKWDGLAQHIASVIHDNTDVTILSIFCDLVEVSVYSVYYLVIKGIRFIIIAFSSGIDASFGNMIANNEKENLNNKFRLYECLYFTIMTIAFSCTMLLITQFVSVYTKGITDANYNRVWFGILITFSEFVFALRQPYNDLIKAAGHFKETRRGAWVEAILNIVISVFLVNKYGLIGVAIGTLVAMTVRGIEFYFHASKYILKRKIVSNSYRILLSLFEATILYIVLRNFNFIEITSYFTWGIQAIIVLVITTTSVSIINAILYRKELKQLKTLGASLLKRNKTNG